VNFASTLLIPTISTGEIDNSGGRFRADSHIRFYAIHAIGLSLPLDSVTRRWRFGLAAYGVTGLGVDYRSTTLDQPRFFDFGPAGKFPLAASEYTNLTILKFTPALAYQVTPEFSLGLALHIDYALLDLKERLIARLQHRTNKALSASSAVETKKSKFSALYLARFPAVPL
jgi:long-chain fatty acid transport protein